MDKQVKTTAGKKIRTTSDHLGKTSQKKSMKADVIKGAATSKNPTNRITIDRCWAEMINRYNELEDAYTKRAKKFGKDKDDEQKAKFFQTLPNYCYKAIMENRLDIPEEHKDNPEYVFYDQYISGNYKYTQQKIDEIQARYKTKGASSIVCGWDILNAFGYYNQIGRAEGNFVTSLMDDLKVCKNGDALNINTFTKDTHFAQNDFKTGDEIADAKGLDAGKYNDGMFMYYYSPEFIGSANALNGLITANGQMQGASHLNIPGMMTWAESTDNSESEMIVPAILLPDRKVRTLDDVHKLMRDFESDYSVPTNRCLIKGKKFTLKGKVIVKPIMKFTALPDPSKLAKDWKASADKRREEAALAAKQKKKSHSKSKL